jgi:hypothetical protein
MAVRAHGQMPSCSRPPRPLAPSPWASEGGGLTPVAQRRGIGWGSLTSRRFPGLPAFGALVGWDRWPVPPPAPPHRVPAC